ncbi:hypothetical protein ACFQU8_06860 [Lentibacillus kimchii]|uniref:Uncharacterized protein n=2 Tax=Lentibacillus kimchii TaxID=1542911 RepID=A0ABW2USZ8_9BACI
MNEQLQELIGQTRKTLGLNNHTLKRHNIFREINAWCETYYLLSMEWFPNDAVIVDEDLNPAGTASVEINLFTKEIRNITFVENVNTADTSIYPKLENKKAMIKWIETMTGLTYDRHFIRENDTDEEHKQRFMAAVEHTPVYPGGNILIKVNDDGILTVFDINGVFPNEDQIASEPFALTLPQYESVAQAACKLLTLPDQAKEAWVFVYGIEEFYLTNDGKQTVPYENKNLSSYVEEDMILTWSAPLNGEFTTQAINRSSVVTLETALANKAHPDAYPLTEAEVAACEQEVLRFMRLVYPDDSGKWRLTGIYLDNNLIIAEISAVTTVQNVLNPKIKLIINRDTLTALNYIDQNRLFAGMFQTFTETRHPEVSQTEAFNTLREHLEVRPVYVHDSGKNRYFKYAKINCAYGVNAVTGELMDLTDV